MISLSCNLFDTLNLLLFTSYLLGGNVGLFTGMSILSLFEIGFWLVRFVLRTSKGGKKGTGVRNNSKKQHHLDDNHKFDECNSLKKIPPSA